MAESQSCGNCCGHSHDHGSDPAAFALGRSLTPIGIAALLFLVGLIFNQPLHQTPWAVGEYAVLLPAYLISGWSVLTSAGRNILKGQVFDENFLMTIATLGAIAIHEIPEAVGVMLFFQVGELFQGYAVGRSRRSIKALLEVRPDTAHLQTSNGLESVSPESVNVGDVVVVKPGEKVPLDGEILEGRSLVDTAALTGESVPRSVTRGETVLAGMINQSGTLTVRVTQPFGQSSIAKILTLVETASGKKADTEKFITRFARHYTPVVVFLSLAIALLPPLILPGATLSEWAYRALVLLVISCPCGLVISIPLGYFGGVGKAAKRGILVKGSMFLDALTQVKMVVFDKTGTLTQGNFRVTAVNPHNGMEPGELLHLAAQAEAQSNHPIAQSIRQAYDHASEGQVAVFHPSSTIEDYEEIAGHGIRAMVAGRMVVAGSDRLLHSENIPHDTVVCQVDGTVTHVAVNGEYQGHILIADELKADAVTAIRNLHHQGIKTAMLTGDSRAVGDRIAQQLGLDQYRADLLPEDKVTELETFLQQIHQQGGKVAFVGDGINDAPAIARADVGMAMGGLGSDAAIETADVVIMTDAPSKVAEAVAIAHQTLGIVWQNIILAMAVKALFIALGAIGIANLWEAVFADVGVALLAILNAGRILRSE